MPEKPAARARYFPSSIGVSVLVPASAKTVKVRVSWGDYRLRTEPPEQWERTAREEAVAIELAKASERPVEKEIPNSNGLKIAYLARAVGMLAADAGVPADARTVSVFLVNRRTRYARRTVVTACSERVDFKNVVRHGDLVELTAEVVATGRSSMTVAVKLFSEDLLSGDQRLCAQGRFVLVALDNDGRPTMVDPFSSKDDTNQGAANGPDERK